MPEVVGNERGGDRRFAEVACPDDLERRTGPGSKLPAKLAGFIVGKLNTSLPGTILNIGQLDRDIVTLLAGGPEDGEEDDRYVQKLVALRLHGPQTTPLQGAATYFERVLERPLFLHSSQEATKAHKLFLTLCRRGSDPFWQTARLARTKHSSVAGAGLRPSEFADIRARLVALMARRGEVSSRNPARSIRAKRGALYLTANGSSVEVSEEMSVWDAICCAPRHARLLAGAELEGFYKDMIRAVEAANDSWGAMVAAHVSPIHSNDLSIYAATRMATFSSRVRERAKKMGCSPNLFKVWEAVWAEFDVPGFASAAEFWSSPYGRQMRTSSGGFVVVGIEKADRAVGEQGEPPRRLTHSEVLEEIETFKEHHDLDSYDEWFILGLSRGMTLDEIGKDPKTKTRFGKHEVPDWYCKEIVERFRKLRV